MPEDFFGVVNAPGWHSVQGIEDVSALARRDPFVLLQGIQKVGDGEHGVHVVALRLQRAAPTLLAIDEDNRISYLQAHRF